jgi:glutaredoxin
MSRTSVELFCAGRCGRCDGLERWLDDRGVAVVRRDVLADPDAAAAIEKLGLRSLPVVRTLDGRIAAGTDTAALKALLPSVATPYQHPQGE